MFQDHEQVEERETGPLIALTLCLPWSLQCWFLSESRGGSKQGRDTIPVSGQGGQRDGGCRLPAGLPEHLVLLLWTMVKNGISSCRGSVQEPLGPELEKDQERRPGRRRWDWIPQKQEEKQGSWEPQSRQGERQGRWELQNKLTGKFWDRFCPLLLGRRLGNGYPKLMGLMLSLCL